MHLTTIPLLAFGLFLISGVQSSHEAESGLMEYYRRAEETTLNDEWTDLTTGLMMQGPPHNSSQILRRDRNEYKRETNDIHVQRDIETGRLVLPRSWKDVASLSNFVSHHVRRRASRGMRVIITWYTGHDLLYPSCLSSTSWAPTDDSMVGAVTIAWSSKPVCGQFVKIRHATNKKKWIVVRIMDSCAGCASGSAHIDLTKKAFTTLYDLDVGLVTGLQAQFVGAPVGYAWTDRDVALYGPQHLS